MITLDFIATALGVLWLLFVGFVVGAMAILGITGHKVRVVPKQEEQEEELDIITEVEPEETSDWFQPYGRRFESINRLHCVNSDKD